MFTHHRNNPAKRLSAAERKKLPTKAFGVPKDRKYPMMVINKMGKPEWSHSHAVIAKADAKKEFDRELMTKIEYDRIAKKANKIIEGAVDIAIPTPGRKKENPGRSRHGMRKTNPTAEMHEKTGRDYMMKARDYWDRYLEHHHANDLVDAFEYLSIAHQELMYAGDDDALKEVKHGKKIAKAELIAKIRPKRAKKKRATKKKK